MPQNEKTNKSPPRTTRFSGLQFLPRFEYGHMAEIAETCGEGEGAAFGTGFARFKNARIPWTVHYDEMLLVLEGVLHVHIGKEAHVLGERDSLWLPAETELIYESENALVAYSIHPINWQPD